jgi:hypothetical protein
MIDQACLDVVSTTHFKIPHNGLVPMVGAQIRWSAALADVPPTTPP